MPAIDRSVPSTLNNAGYEEEGLLNESFASVAAFEEIKNGNSNIANPRTSTPIPNEDTASNMSMVSNMSTEELNASLESVRPLPTAPERKTSNRGRKKRRSEVLTSSPVLAELCEEQDTRANRKAAVEAKKNSFSCKESSFSFKESSFSFKENSTDEKGRQKIKSNCKTCYTSRYACKNCITSNTDKYDSAAIDKSPNEY